MAQEHRTVAQINAATINQPRRTAAINAVRVATQAGETNVQRQRTREAQEAAA